jgi:hexokinase
LTHSDIVIISGICRAISHRAAAYLAIMVFSLWRLQRDTFTDRSVEMGVHGAMRVAYCGAVLEKHPSIRMLCQKYLDELVDAEPFETGKLRDRLVLEHADDSGLLGAAVGSVVNGGL